MARRIVGGAEGRKITKEAEKKANIKRKQNTRNERETLIIACEDKVSAPLYFNAIFDDLKRNHAIATSSLVVAEHNHTDPCGVLQDLLNYSGYQDFDHQWIVIDRDEERTNGGGHTLENFNQALAKADRNKIKVAYANPCFEIWYLLHFEYRNTAIDRENLNGILVRDYQYAKNRLFTIVIDPDLQETAIRNSKQLIKSWIEIQGKIKPVTDNPSTTVHDLIELLNSFKKNQAA